MPSRSARLVTYLRETRLLFLLAALYAAIEMALVLGDAGYFEVPRFRSQAYEYFGFWPGLLSDWRPNYAVQPLLMFFTYGFLHTGILHLAANMVTLVSIGRPVLVSVGAWRFLLIYAASILGGAAGFALLSDTFRPMVGASGALFGLAGAILAWEYVGRVTDQAGIWPVVRAILLLLALNVVLYFAMDRLLAWEAHLGGFVAGWIMALVIPSTGRSQ